MTKAVGAWGSPVGRLSLPVLRRPLLADALLALAVLLTALPHAAPALRHDRTDAFVFSVALALPLVWRRRAPLPVFVAVCAVAFLQWLTTGPVVADLALLIAFYTVAATCSRRLTLAAVAVLEVGVVLALVRYAGEHRNYLLGLLFLSGLVTAAGVLGANVRVRRAYLQEVEQRAARLEYERDQQGRLAVAAERGRIAREMHDIIAHNLSVMIALADGAALTAGSDPSRARDAMVEASAAGRRALGEMRRVLGVLRDASDAADLAPAPGVSEIDRLLPTIRQTGLQASYTCEGSPAALPAGVQLSIYRLVQESLTNTVKHAVDAHRVAVTLRCRPDWIEVDVTDDGVSRAAPATPPGHGITGMRERISVHAGQVDVGPTATGWRVHARIPATQGEPWPAR